MRATTPSNHHTYEELDNFEDQWYCLVPRPAFRNCYVKGRTSCETKCDQEEEQMTGEVGGVVPGGRNAGEFGDGGGNLFFFFFF